MKSFKTFINENEDPYHWDTNYGKRFKFVHTPEGKQDSPQDHPTISLVTPANGDAWNWPEVSQQHLAQLKANWSEIQKTIAPHKRIQIETLQNASAEK
jgi:hypothetical protein